MRSLVDEVTSRLKNGVSLADLSLPVKDARLVINSVSLRRSSPARTAVFGRIKFSIGTPNVLSDIRWNNMHFTGCTFSGVKFFGGSFDNCVFERCEFDHAGFWDFEMSTCRFAHCGLRGVAFGGVNELGKVKKPNSLVSVSFDRCDMRESAHSCEEYRFCEFRNCKLDGVQFLGAVFEDCQFIGRLNEVEFRRFDGQANNCRPNELLRCDFRNAGLIDCQFLNISMDPALFPAGDDWIVLPRGPEDLRAWQQRFETEDWYIQRLIRLSGAPTIISRSTLVQAGFTPDQIGELLAVAEGNGPLR